MTTPKVTEVIRGSAHSFQYVEVSTATVRRGSTDNVAPKTQTPR